MSSYYSRKNKPSMKFRFSFVLLFVFASFAACFAFYMREGDPPVQKEGEVIDVADTETPSVNERPQVQRESTDDINPVPESVKLDKVYFESCMFAGDSLMVGLGTYGIIPEGQVAAGIGMSVMSINDTPLVNADGSEILAADKINGNAPQNLYILLGLNLLGQYTDEQLLAAYGDFIDSIDSSITIYVISVPPVTASREADPDNPILNSDIDKFNEDLLKFANNRSVYYLDLNSALKGEDGTFPEDMAEQDGIHFKRSTYDIMLDYILTHVKL